VFSKGVLLERLCVPLRGGSESPVASTGTVPFVVLRVTLPTVHPHKQLQQTRGFDITCLTWSKLGFGIPLKLPVS